MTDHRAFAHRIYDMRIDYFDCSSYLAGPQAEYSGLRFAVRHKFSDYDTAVKLKDELFKETGVLMNVMQVGPFVRIFHNFESTAHLQIEQVEDLISQNRHSIALAIRSAIHQDREKLNRPEFNWRAIAEREPPIRMHQFSTNSNEVMVVSRYPNLEELLARRKQAREGGQPPSTPPAQSR